VAVIDERSERLQTAYELSARIHELASLVERRAAEYFYGLGDEVTAQRPREKAKRQAANAEEDRRALRQLQHGDAAEVPRMGRAGSIPLSEQLKRRLHLECRVETAACPFPGRSRRRPRRAAGHGTRGAVGRSFPIAADSRRPSRRGGSARRLPIGRKPKVERSPAGRRRDLVGGRE
jgi:hypothetical protein